MWGQQKYNRENRVYLVYSENLVPWKFPCIWYHLALHMRGGSHMIDVSGPSLFWSPSGHKLACSQVNDKTPNDSNDVIYILLIMIIAHQIRHHTIIIMIIIIM